MLNLEIDIIDEGVLPLLDIFTILLVEDNPIPGIVLLTLLKMVTKDRMIRISFILLVIAFGSFNSE